VAQIPLRDLAAELRTSDRMLLYYFDNVPTPEKHFNLRYRVSQSLIQCKNAPAMRKYSGNAKTIWPSRRRNG
jgi:hypothetical protein